MAQAVVNEELCLSLRKRRIHSDLPDPAAPAGGQNESSPLLHGLPAAGQCSVSGCYGFHTQLRMTITVTVHVTVIWDRGHVGWCKILGLQIKCALV